MAEQDIISALREIATNVKDIEDIIRDASGKQSFGTAESTRKAAKLDESSSFQDALDQITTDKVESDSSAITDGLATFSKGTKSILSAIRDNIPGLQADELSNLVDTLSAEVSKLGKGIFDTVLSPKKLLESVKENFDSNPEIAAQVVNVLKGFVQIPFGTTVLNKIDEGLLTNFQGIQKVFGGSLADIDSKVKISSGNLGTFLSNSARSTNDAIAGSTGAAGKALDAIGADSSSRLLRIGDETKTTAASINTAYKNFMEDATGTTATSIKVNGASIAVALENYQETFNQRVLPMLQDSREGFSLAAEAATEGGRGIFQEIALAGDAFNLSNDKVQTFIARNRDLTGKANTDLLKSSAAVSSAIGDRMGINAKQIMPIMSEIIGSVDRFGNVGVEAAGKISAQLIKTGTDFSQLSTMVGTFQGFEGASSSVAKLTAAFGVNLDAMELMRMANEDQAALIPYLQEQFEASGVDIANSGNAMKRVLSEALGGLGVNNVERLLSGTADVFGDFNKQIGEDASKAINDPLRTFEASIKDLTAVLGDPAQAAARQTESMAAATVGQVIAAAVGTANTETLKGITDIVGKMEPEIARYGLKLSQLVSDPINAAISSFGNIKEVIKSATEGTTADAKPSSPPAVSSAATAAPPVTVALPAVPSETSSATTQANTATTAQNQSAQAAANPARPQTLQAVINISLGDDVKKIIQNVALIDITGGDLA